MGGLSQYVEEQLTKGYNVNDIRQYLLRYGYSPTDVDAAIQSIHHNPPQFTHIFSHSVTAAIVIVLALGLGIGIYFTLPTTTTPTLIISSPTQASPQSSLSISYSIGSFTSPLSITYTITDVTSKVLSRGKATLTLKSGSFSTTAPALQGTYKLTAQGQTNGRRIESSTSFIVSTIDTSDTCTNGVIDQGEGGVDCGGQCKPCTTTSCTNAIQDGNEQNIDCGGDCGPCENPVPLTCDDKNPCTQDEQVRGSCRSIPILPCCGNTVCEPNEQQLCTEDCSSQTVRDFYNLPILDIVDEAISSAATNPAKSRSLCGSIKDEAFFDNCFRDVAKITHATSDCDNIQTVKKKESCYTDIADATQSIDTCLLIINNDRRDFCIQKLQNNHGIFACDKYTNTLLREGCEFLKAERP